MVTELAAEMKTYEDHKDELVGNSNGKFVLIHGSKILGTYETQTDALGEGFRQLGNIPFLVKQIQAVDTPVNFVSGLLRI